MSELNDRLVQLNFEAEVLLMNEKNEKVKVQIQD